ncbi:hypothetical protein HYH03_007259 [Edaphochlamys debaryana]|uniref:Protein kinase domain-containing protein n=1 Tax=Edaphochlamys debaryana TaxID=47281 RepID=A0A835Y235_9CHLO|nr:hypothetical protein HYH03_007259 [Edaphochlamys debaryana]|eukprot:KAG2494490.1 hypothetical protein HYH03_007259 [Edaphochlamys debaryana]
MGLDEGLICAALAVLLVVVASNGVLRRRVKKVSQQCFVAVAVFIHVKVISALVRAFGEQAEGTSVEKTTFGDKQLAVQEAGASKAPTGEAPLVPPAWSFEVPWSELSKHELRGVGGVGVVYKAMYKKCTEVALKRLKISSPEELRKEYGFLRSLPYHEQIVTLYGITTEANERTGERQQWLVMGWCHQDLQHLFLKEAAKQPQDKKLTLAKALEVAMELAQGLNFLHSNNVLLTKDLRVKITDFGISRTAGPDGKIHSMQGQGSMLWMAPELIVSGDHKPAYTKEVDVYAWGVIFCQLISRLNHRIYELLQPELIQGASTQNWSQQLRHLGYVRAEALQELPTVLLSKLPKQTEHLPFCIRAKALQLARDCLRQDSAERPTMAIAAERVREMLEMHRAMVNLPGGWNGPAAGVSAFMNHRSAPR